MIMKKPLIIAYYLPQYHPFPQNDEWWGKGFTEWTNVGKAKPLFKGHYQPKVPADLGYYDLRLPEVRDEQAELAREAGVGAFCYWHYWFGGKGRQLLNEIIDDVLKTGKPDFPFCFGWANESWKAKQWNKDETGDKVIMEQRYGGESDYRLHFEYALNFFKDHRYIKIDNKPLFLVYKPNLLPSDFISYWNKWAKEEGFDGIYFVARVNELDNPKDAFAKGFKIYTQERSSYVHKRSTKMQFFKNRIMSWMKGLKGTVVEYADCIKFMSKPEEDIKENFCPVLLPNWDHSPRSGKSAYIIHNATPKLFKKHCKQILHTVMKKQNKIVFLKSWNEWGEGNYMEPDLKYGKGFIRALHDALEESE